MTLAVESQPIKRGRGRPRKIIAEAPIVKRGPGRPRKIVAGSPAVEMPTAVPLKRGPGRPRKDGGSSTRANNAIAWIEKYCFIPEGMSVGQPVRLRPWQKEILRRVYGNPAGTRRVIISFGRKNGKTSFSAFVLLLHLCGPEAKPNSQLYSAAQSRDQASLIFNLAAKIVKMSPDLRGAIIIRDTKKELFCTELGTIYRALSAEATTAYGLSPALVLHDELGQVQGPRSPLYEALETATGAQQNPMSIVISTQARTDADLLSALIDGALKRNDPRTVVCLHTAPVEIDPFSEEAIKLANPAFGEFLSTTEVLDMAENARAMPSREAEYRNLILNQRIAASNYFIDPPLWKACDGPVADLSGVPVYAGLDLSAVRDLTALVLIGQIDGVWHVEPTFWLPKEGLEHKSIADRTPYDLWVQQGFLQTTPGPTISYEYVAEYLRGVFDRYDIRKLAFDDWNWRFFQPWLIKAGFTEQFLEDRFENFRQGMKSMSPALRSLEEVVTKRQLAHGGHPVLARNIVNAVVEIDSAENKKLSKAKSNGRIDGLQALGMAFGVAPLKDAIVDIEALIG